MRGCGSGRCCWRGFGLRRSVGLGDELEVEDEVGLGGNDGGTASFAVCELIGDEEATLAADVHALETGVPAWNNAVSAVGEGDGFFAGMVKG